MKAVSIFAAEHEADFAESLAFLDREQAPPRVWQRDHTLWSPQPAEITDRLGWLDVMGPMHGHLPQLKAFAEAAGQDGIADVVLLGMGGSSLGAEVLNRVLGSRSGYPRLTVLDSTIPETVAGVRASIEPSRTLFLVSSKSGTTAETRALFDYFREAEAGGGNTGGHFAAITDPGTPLAGLAREQGFRHVFENPADIGGRYSVLSYFGLVPAALLGVDIEKLLGAADVLRERCAAAVPAEQNEGCRLGACLGALAKRGRDKVTIVTSPALDSFGLWAEQLIAESTGKQGRGLVPVAGEPLAGAAAYGRDRLFVYIRLKDDDNTAVDAFVAAMKNAGHPVAVMELADRYELGAVFYLWEFAVAVAGSLIGIQPFNQPDVQRAKDATRAVLEQYTNSGKLPSPPVSDSPSALLAQAKEGDYFAVMAYLRQTPEADRAFATLRRRVLEKHRLATTLGYGPRFLHSTGQLHKGGPNSGLFLQVVPDHYQDLPVPGRPYSFGVMSNAESLGDLQALRTLGRRVVRVERDAAGLAGLADTEFI
jgi:glucose-6-phosphate isomerase